MSMMVKTHLGPNTEVHQTHFKRLQWQYRGWRVIPSKMTLISPPTDITGKDNTYIVMVTWAGVGLHMSATPRSFKGHLKVTTRSNQSSDVCGLGTRIMVV